MKGAVTFMTLLFILNVKQVTSWKILVVPLATAFNSHFRNFDLIADLLMRNGHDVSILVTSEMKPLILTQNVTFYETQNPDYSVLLARMDADNYEYQRRMDSTWKCYAAMINYAEFEIPYCDAMLKDKFVLQRVKNQQFDLMLVDYADDCGRILKLYLQIPTLLYNSLGFLPRQNSLWYPNIPSFVCTGSHCHTDRMTFMQRAENFAQYLLGYFLIYPEIDRMFDFLKKKHRLAPGVSVSEAFIDSLVIHHVTFALDYPRPLMPNIIPFPGLHTAVKPLPHDLQNFLDNSPPEGAIIISLGTIMDSLPKEDVMKFFNVFSRLKHRVIWRYSGDLANHPNFPQNVWLVGSFPQNDALAHPSVKLFISHCGMSVILETMHHGVPVLGFPNMDDQFMHVRKMVDRGIAKQMNKNDFTEKQLYDNIVEMTTNVTYRTNAEAIADIVNDKLMDSRDLLLYYINYVARHKGAKHLVSSAVHELNIFQYLCLDVVGFFGIVVVVVFYVVYAGAKYAWKLISGKKQKRE